MCAVVLTPWPEQQTAMEISNRATIERLGEVEVECLARVPSPAIADLANTGQPLPWQRWLSAPTPRLC